MRTTLILLSFCLLGTLSACDNAAKVDAPAKDKAAVAKKADDAKKTDAKPAAKKADDAKAAAKKMDDKAPAMQSAAIGKAAPDFTLMDMDGKPTKLSDHKGKMVVLEWFNPDCPFVKAAHTTGELKTMAKDHAGKDIVWLAINSGAPGKQGNGKETNTKGKEAFGISHPILFDETGAVGKAYGAQKTPHMYLINKEGVLVYRGALDNTGSGNNSDVPKVENYLANAIKETMDGKPVSKPVTKAWGCGVKYGS